MQLPDGWLGRVFCSEYRMYLSFAKRVGLLSPLQAHPLSGVEQQTGMEDCAGQRPQMWDVGASEWTDSGRLIDSQARFKPNNICSWIYCWQNAFSFSSFLLSLFFLQCG